MSSKPIAIIPARGGSKGIPRKNIRPLLGRPLIEWTIEVALRAELFERVITSTDDPEIAAIARAAGSEVPFLRPPELATDTASTASAVRHVLLQLLQSSRLNAEHVFILEPTSPCRRVFHLQGALELLLSTGADSLASVSPVPHHYRPDKQLTLSLDDELCGANGTPVKDMIHRRQELKTTYAFDGIVFACKRELPLSEPATIWGTRVAGYRTDPMYAFDLDRPEDWPAAESRLREILSQEMAAAL
jgi:CMP-N,N'-diacetyllegionaminic acid synthase